MISNERRAVFDIMSVTANELHRRAASGIFTYDPAGLAYLKGCKLVSIDVGATVLFAFEDLASLPRAKLDVASNPRLRIQAHLSVQAVPHQVIRAHKARNPEWRQVDEWGDWQLSLWTMTFFPDAYRSAWCELFESPQKGSAPSFHARVIVEADDKNKRWAPVKSFDLAEQTVMRRWGWQPYGEYFHRIQGAPH